MQAYSHSKFNSDLAEQLGHTYELNQDKLMHNHSILSGLCRMDTLLVLIKKTQWTSAWRIAMTKSWWSDPLELDLFNFNTEP